MADKTFEEFSPASQSNWLESPTQTEQGTGILICAFWKVQILYHWTPQ